MQIIINFMKLVLFTICILSLEGCSPTKFHYYLKDQILNSHDNIIIKNNDFEDLQDKSKNSIYYISFGVIDLDIFNIQMEPLYETIPTFKKILYNPKDSTLLIEGILFEERNYHREYECSQIIIGYLPVLSDSSFVGNIIYNFNYLIPENGEFSLALKIDKDLQLIFAPRELYSEKGEYWYTPLGKIKVYDIYKLLDKYKVK